MRKKENKMANNTDSSSFFFRLSLSRSDREASSLLPLHHDTAPSSSSSPPPWHTTLRHKASEYDLSEMSPYTTASPAAASPTATAITADDDGVLFSAADPEPAFALDSASAPRLRKPALFAGPPPPIATSMLLYRDIEDRDSMAATSVLRKDPYRRPPAPVLPLSSQKKSKLTALTAGLGRHSTMHESAAVSSTARRGVPPIAPLDGQSTWLLLQRRQRALQREIQALLDVQSAGLLAGLGRGPALTSAGSSASAASSSDGGGVSAWDDQYYGSSSSNSSSIPTTMGGPGRTAAMAASASAPSRPFLPFERTVAASTVGGGSGSGGGTVSFVIPVRQPRAKKMGLRGARAGLGRSMAQLAALKAEEDAAVADALRRRERALAQLQRLTSRRDGIRDALQALEGAESEAESAAATEAEDVDSKEGGEPLARELRTLTAAHADTGRQISELERQLAMLRSRQQTLAARMADVQSRREAGLSGYRGALKEVDAQLADVLRRPLVQPLDVDVLGGGGGSGRNDSDVHTDRMAGFEFLQMRPERRTPDMARLWWQSEIALLQRRKAEMDAERAALEQGSVVWAAVVQLVSGFETELRKEMAGGAAGDMETPEQRMRLQLRKMDIVMAGLQEHLHTAEDKGWNLLICAIGAELEAFQEARQMLREALQVAGLEDEEEKGEGQEGEEDGNSAGKTDRRDDYEDSSSTPRLAQSMVKAGHGRESSSNSLDIRAEPAAVPPSLMDDDRRNSESDDNDVPPGLFEPHDTEEDSLHDKDDASENEVPLEFLAEHHE